MARKPIPLVCNKKDRAKLEKLSRSRTASKQLVDRAKIILDCLEGKKNKDIASIIDFFRNSLT